MPTHCPPPPPMTSAYSTYCHSDLTFTHYPAHHTSHFYHPAANTLSMRGKITK
ncbi:hypothetical protein [Rubritalea tangerina]|uniref:hypothetical protein n=1 Tax=Rubritalea tangerina TaxID=430798 RepID=UPI00361571AF